MSKAQLWVRVGDKNEYCSFDDDLCALVDHLIEHDVTNPIRRSFRGIEARDNFFRNTYITLYWGDSEGGFIQEINDEDFEAIKAELKWEDEPSNEMVQKEE